MYGDVMEEPSNPRGNQTLLQAFLACWGHQPWRPWMLLEAEHQPAGLWVEEKGYFSLLWHEERGQFGVYQGL